MNAFFDWLGGFLMWLEPPLAWLESTWLATFVREDPSFFGYPTFLFAHTFGLAVVVGVSTILAARLLGMGSGIPIAPLVRLFPLMWAGFIINLISGAGLWLADAVNKTIPGNGNQAPIFATKMFFVVVGAILLWRIQQRLSEEPEAINPHPSGEMRNMSAALLVCWVLAMIAGRLIGYTSAILG
jgi:hypothetical protein